MFLLVKCVVTSPLFIPISYELTQQNTQHNSKAKNKKTSQTLCTLWYSRPKALSRERSSSGFFKAIDADTLRRNNQSIDPPYEPIGPIFFVYFIR